MLSGIQMLGYVTVGRAFTVEAVVELAVSLLQEIFPNHICVAVFDLPKSRVFERRAFPSGQHPLRGRPRSLAPDLGSNTPTHPRSSPRRYRDRLDEPDSSRAASARWCNPQPLRD